MISLRIEAVNPTTLSETRNYILTYFTKMGYAPEERLQLVRILSEIGEGLEWALGIYLMDTLQMVNLLVGPSPNPGDKTTETYMVWHPEMEDAEEIEETRIN